MTKTLVVLAGLAALTLSAFWPVTGYEFLNYDDDAYVCSNRHVAGGLSGENIRWAFTGFGYAANWHPLTWISHQLDVTLFGLNPGRHHLVNLLFHTASALLLFLLLRLATGALGTSAVMAALFAVHPLRVESVAWIAERKDVLSGFFWMSTMLLYVVYVRRPGTARYLALTACFALGLLAKPMLVSLPLILFLFDGWPLGRWCIPGRSWTAARRAILSSLVEKLPLALLAAASAVVTYQAQHWGGGLVMSSYHPLGARLANAVVSLVAYIGKLLLPRDLAVFYPFRESIPPAGIAAAALLAVGITAACLAVARRRPWLPAGWLWYLITILPVIGILQVGFQSMADRYSYLPSIGLFLMAAGEIGEHGRRHPRRQALLAGAAAGALLLLAAAARHQVRFWQDSETLFRRATAVTADNWLAENNLGTALEHKGKLDEAIEHYTKALQLKPDYARARVSLGNVFLAQGKTSAAIAQYDEALRLNPSFSLAWYNRGRALVVARRYEAALDDFFKTLALHHDSADVHGNLGATLLDLGRTDEAMRHFQEALRLDPTAILPRLNIGLVLYKRGMADEADLRFREVIRLDPGRPEAHFMLGRLAERGGRVEEAVSRYREALRLRPDYPEARGRLERLTPERRDAVDGGAPPS